MPKPRSKDENRDYQRPYMRLRRAEGARDPLAPVVAKATENGHISLLRAGIRKGARYTATQQGDGSILLTPL